MERKELAQLIDKVVKITAVDIEDRIKANLDPTEEIVAFTHLAEMAAVYCVG